MASNTYTQHYANGTKQLVRRSKKQGCKKKSPELVKIPLTVFVLPQTKNRLIELAKEHNMTLSAYGDLALSLFDINQFSTVEDCSIQ